MPTRGSVVGSSGKTVNCSQEQFTLSMVNVVPSRSRNILNLYFGKTYRTPIFLEYLKNKRANILLSGDFLTTSLKKKFVIR